MIDYLCMDSEELTLWTEAALAYLSGRGTRTPCTDCPMWFHLQEKAAGRCNRTPNATGRPPGPHKPDHRGVFEDRRHQQWREASLRYKQRRRLEATG
jgi:hypothetical protein